MTPFETLVKYRAAYGDKMTPAQKGELLNRVAWDFRDQGMALLGKAGGSNVPTPDGHLISSDYLVHVPTQTGHDVLTGNDTRDAIPVSFEWGPGPEDLAGYLASKERTIVLPTKPVGVIDLPADPADTTGDTDTHGDTNNVAVLEQKVSDLEGAFKNLKENALARLKWLETGETGPDYEGEGAGDARIFGYRVPFTVSVLSHPIKKTDA